MRILLLNQTFFPDPVATAQHMTDLALFVTQRGHRFDVIASRSPYHDHDSLLRRYEELEGVHIYRVGRSLFRKRGLVRRLANFALYYVGAAVQAFRVPRPDVVLCLTTPPFIVTLGFLLRLIRGSRVVYHVMDLYPDVAVACGMMRKRGLAARILERINRYCLAHADRTIALGRCMRERIEAKIGPAGNLSVVTPWADGDEITPVPSANSAVRRDGEWGDKFVVAYCGNLGLAHDLKTVLGAVRAMSDDPTVHFAFIGGGRRRRELDQAVEAYELSNVTVLDYQPRDRLGETLSAGDVHLISMLDGAAGSIVPSKLYGIMAAGRPTIFIGPAMSEVARTLTENGCGFVLATGDVEGLVDRIGQLRSDRELAREMGSRARRAFLEHFERKGCCERLLEVLTEAVRTGKSASVPAKGGAGATVS